MSASSSISLNADKAARHKQKTQNAKRATVSAQIIFISNRMWKELPHYKLIPMKHFLLIFALLSCTNLLYSMQAPEFPTVVENEDEPELPANSFHTVLYAGDAYSNRRGRVEGHVFEIGDGKYGFVKDKNNLFSFKPQLKKNAYTGEPIPFDLEEFSKKPEFSNCELLDFVWEDTPTDEKKGIKKIYGVEGLLFMFENDRCQTFILKPQKRYLFRTGNNILPLVKGNLNYFLGNYSNNADIYVRSNHIDRVYGCPANQIKDSSTPLIWHPETRELEDPDFASSILATNYDPKRFIITVLSADGNEATKKVEITAGSDIPISYTENENVLTLTYQNGDYCKFSKLKDYELFEGVIHFPYGVLTASTRSDGNGINKKIECTGKVTSGSNLYGSTYDYNGFTADLSDLKIFLNKQSDYTNYIVKFDDSDQLQKWIYYKANNYWTLTSTGEKARWKDGELVTESLIEKKKQDELLTNERIRKEVIANYKTQYGASTIDNIMKGHISVGMPWSLVGSVFPNGMFNSSNYSKTYKVINNIPSISITHRKLEKQEYGLGNLVYVTVRNGKVTNVTYTNHR